MLDTNFPWRLQMVEPFVSDKDEKTGPVWQHFHRIDSSGTLRNTVKDITISGNDHL